MQHSSEMPVSTVAVTGAGGFVGDWLTHRLALETDYEVRPLVHSVSGRHPMRLARLPIEIEQGSILDMDRMNEFFEGCDAVVHLAIGDETVTVDGTRVVLSAAERAGVDRFIHMSSAAIHGHKWTGTLDESAPLNPDTEYGEWKVRAEREVATARQRGTLDPTVFRPFIVYGPFCDWVEGGIANVANGAVLTHGAQGAFNQIYIDNLVDAIVLALGEPDAKGEVMFAVDDEPATWREFYARLGDTLERHPPMRDMSKRRIRVEKALRTSKNSVVPPIRLIERVLGSDDVRSATAEELGRTPWAMGAFARMPDPLKDEILSLFYGGDSRYEPASSSVNGSPKTDYAYPTPRFMDMHASTGRLSNEKLASILGWESRVSFDESMDRIGEWLEYAGFVSNPQQAA